jgi:branched-chain amino acid transport system permease protein
MTDKTPTDAKLPKLLDATGRILSDLRTSYAAIAIATVGGALLAMTVEGYFNFVLAMVAMNILVGVGLNVLLGLSGQVSFGHIGFFAIGAYATGILMLNGFGFWSAFLLAGVISAAIGLLLALPALRVTGPYLAMMTIAFAFIIEHGAIEWRAVTGGSNGLMGFPSPELFGTILTEADVAVFAAIVAGLSLFFYQRLTHSTWGRAMRAVRDSEIAAQSIGLNPLVLKTVSFVLSALLTGLAGAIFAPMNMFISPSSFPFFQSILFILAVVVGGAGTLWGPVLGALLVVLLPEFLSDFAEYRLLLFGTMLLAVLWAAPRGIVGTIAGWLTREGTARAPSDAGDIRDLLAAGDGPSLVVEGIGISFGGVKAAQNVSFTAEPGRITSVIGPNGAGKTTVLNMIGGFYKPQTGEIRLDGTISGLFSHAIARAGISRTYQTTLLFEQMSVVENVMIAARQGRLGALLTGGGEAKDRELAVRLLAFVGYGGPLARLAGNLPHVDKRLVEIARALATGPKVLLLDEPAAGLMREDKDRLASLLREIAGLGIAVILVEHDMSLVMGISDHVVVLDAGEPLTQGTPREVQDNPAVLRAYLGAADYKGRPREKDWRGEMFAVLTAHQLEAGYGAAPALDGVHVDVYPGELVAVLGANGAGKSTMLRAMSGLHRPVSGSVLLNDEETSRKPAHEIAAAGMVLVPEGRQVFPDMTLLDNILLGAWTRKDPVSEAEIEAITDRFPRIRDRLNSKAGVLSGGEQQMLAIARGLIAKPKILLLDEPSLGLAPSMIGELYDTVADLRDAGVTILIVDQMANLALTVADRGYVLENGRIAHSGKAADLASDEGVARAYLGHSAGTS